MSLRIISRLHFVLLIVALLVSVAISRLFFLQIIKYSTYSKLVEKQQGFAMVLEPERGGIVFQTKDGESISAATTKTGALLYVNMKFLEDAEKVYAKLNALTAIDLDLFKKITKKTNDPYEVLKRRLPKEVAEKILAMNLPGIGLKEEKWRFYPAGKSASHLLGFVSMLNDASGASGQYGIEKFYDNALRGKRGNIFGDADGKGTPIALWEWLRVDAKEGEDIVLTIEPTVQRIAEEELRNLKKRWGAASGGIIILDPKTGAIYAMAAEPGFDPNEYQNEKNLGVFLNPFVEKIFELGSVFKPLTMAAAIDRGRVKPETVYVDKGEVQIGDRVIKNFDGKAHGERTMTQVLEESLNTGAVFAMQQIGGENLKEYFYKFGLGERLGIDLPGEVRGDLSNLESGREIEFATASFGQGIAVTPLELAMALSSLANGGKLMRPFVNYGIAPQIIREVIKPETSETVTKMLVDVVDTALIGGKAKMPHMSIAAKTGTAQMPNIGGRGYSDQYLHSFFGYFPAYNPRFLIFIFLERPQGVKYASQSITDTFKSLVEFLINYYTISPDR